jgi:hypothetical protein
MARKISLEYQDFLELTDFVEAWGRNLSKIQFQTMLQDSTVIETVTNFVANEIREQTNNDKFALFMADRTFVEAIPTNRGISFHVGGYSEQEMLEMGRDARISQKAIDEGKDYNLWEMYEFHGKGITGVTLKQGTKGAAQKIVKDAGGVVTVKSKTGEAVELKGRAGLIGAVIDQLRPELAARIAELIGSQAQFLVADAADDAAKKARKLKGLDKVTNVAMQKAAKEYKVDLAKLSAQGVTAAPSAQGVILTRGSGGKFVSSPLHGKKVSVTGGGKKISSK